MSQNNIFELEVEKLGKICRFTLSVQGKRISSQELDYPLSLKRSYQEWQQAYLNCYCKFHHSRGKVITSGSFSTPTPDREKVLRDAEAQLLSDFHRWLRSEQLHAIRDEISHAAFYPTNSEGQWVEVFLTCKNPELERLPWEAWEINTKLSAPGTKSIRIAHVPRNLHYAPVAPLRRKARVLAILGD
ncbi:MAG: histidine kinase, partial [Symploca sp. SIO2E6]|nr:histidine kinase [Symploca sp. SIO2E6]